MHQYARTQDFEGSCLIISLLNLSIQSRFIATRVSKSPSVQSLIMVRSNSRSPFDSHSSHFPTYKQDWDPTFLHAGLFGHGGTGQSQRRPCSRSLSATRSITLFFASVALSLYVRTDDTTSYMKWSEDSVWRCLDLNVLTLPCFQDTIHSLACSMAR